MRRGRRRAVQVELVFKRRGGRRRGAGRKRRGPRRKVRHARRPDFSARHPMHVTLRVLDAVGRLRRREGFRVVRAAMLVVAPREDFRVVHLSIQGNHLHLICEAQNRLALSRGMSAFKTSLARRLNRSLHRSGPVFADRYHVEILDSVRQTRNAICYVLNNWRRHGEDRGAMTRVDPYSTGIYFRGWCEPDIPKVLVIPEGVEVLPHTPPRTWLLGESWRRAKPISLFEIPGPPASSSP